jgi:enoyl-CoA hydratase/carnithine racemase
MSHVLVHAEAGLLTLSLNRPEKKNALTQDMYSQLAEALRSADQDPTIRAVLLTGSETCFTSGNDVADFLNSPRALGDRPVMQFMRALFDMSKPVVAAVTGPAVGIGTTLLLHCDLVFVSRDARLQMPFVNLGLCPEFGSSVLLPRLVGAPRAAQLLLLGEVFNGEQATAWGLANECLGNGHDTLARARTMALRFTQLAPQAVADSKRLLRGADREALWQVIVQEGELFSQRLRSPEAIEAMSAFMQRRPADFSALS